MRIKIGKQYILIDRADCRTYLQLNWYAGKYVYTKINGKTTYLHRLILAAPEGLEVDHINGNGLDNRRKNLRLATRSQNEMNKPKTITNTSGYKGVSRVSGNNKWRAHIGLAGRKQLYLGCFESVIEAAKAYDTKALELHGEFAYQNFPRRIAP